MGVAVHNSAVAGDGDYWPGTPTPLGDDHGDDVGQAVEVEDAAGPAPDVEEPLAELVGDYWGCFRITPRLPSAQWPCGGWQATCPFHARNAITGCKRYLPIPEPGAADKTLKQLQ
eukprot:8050680-Lingulodinium_polyedra.AAC.1